MSSYPEKIQLLHPDPQKSAPRILRSKYNLIKDNLLEIIPSGPEGVLFNDLSPQVTNLLSNEQLEELGSVTWYVVSIKLDLEAREIIKRIPGSRPQRVRRT